MYILLQVFKNVLVDKYLGWLNIRDNIDVGLRDKKNCYLIPHIE